MVLRHFEKREQRGKQYCYCWVSPNLLFLIVKFVRDCFGLNRYSLAMTPDLQAYFIPEIIYLRNDNQLVVLTTSPIIYPHNDDQLVALTTSPNIYPRNDVIFRGRGSNFLLFEPHPHLQLANARTTATSRQERFMRLFCETRFLVKYRRHRYKNQY